MREKAQRQYKYTTKISALFGLFFLTESNIKELLGEPQKVDFLANGLEKWEYSHLRKAAKAVNYVPVANWFVGGTNDTTKTLVILFEGDVVKNYTTAVAEGETKAGLFQ